MIPVGFAIGVSVAVTLAAGFTVSGLRDAYTWVVLCFAGSAVVMAAFYPGGSAVSRTAQRVR